MQKRKRSTHLEDIVEDGLLCSMISSWPLRDAIRTSIISRRWKHIWKCIPNLDFDANMLSCTAVDTFVDGLLCSMISSWPLRDAIRTSIISGRWKHIWKCIQNLDFDAIMLSFTAADTSVDGIDMEARDALLDTSVDRIDMEARDALLRERTEKFIKSVDAVLKHHKGSGVDLFRINYFLKDAHAYFLDRCVCFAVASKTKELVLELYPCFEPLPTDKPYKFPCQFFTSQRGVSIKRLHLSFCALKPDSSFDGFRYLKVLDLDRVDISEEDIGNFLSNCFTLEKLSIKMCCKLVNLKISHPLGQLNYLTVEYCAQLKKIELHAIKLNAFRYVGCEVDIILGASSQLKEAYITLEDNRPIQCALARFPSSLPHLQFLLYEFGYTPVPVDLSQAYGKFCHLKHLVLIPFAWDDSLEVYGLGLYHLLNAAPFLEKFEVHLQSKPFSLRRDLEEPPALPHSHLRSVVISGFSGYSRQVELVRYLLNNATGLEVMTIDQRRKCYIHPGQFKDVGVFCVARKILKGIRRNAPKNIKLINIY